MKQVLWKATKMVRGLVHFLPVPSGAQYGLSGGATGGP